MRLAGRGATRFEGHMMELTEFKRHEQQVKVQDGRRVQVKQVLLSHLGAGK